MHKMVGLVAPAWSIFKEEWSGMNDAKGFFTF